MNDGGRSVIISALKRELVGPDPYGEELDLSSVPFFKNRTEALGPWIEMGTGQEIITDRIEPMRRYATGVLFPEGSTVFSEAASNETPELPQDPDVEEIEEKESSFKSKVINEVTDDDFDLSPVNEKDPRSSAVTFFVGADTDSVNIRLVGGRYEKFKVRIEAQKETVQTDDDDEETADAEHEADVTVNEDSPDTAAIESLGPLIEDHSAIDVTIIRGNNEWYVRRPVSAVFTKSLKQLSSEGRQFSQMDLLDGAELGPLTISANILARPADIFGNRYVTIAIVNSTKEEDCNSFGLFQTEFYVELESAAGLPSNFLPYNEREDSALLKNSAEARSLQLLYRNYRTFAIGHGCSANWNEVEGKCTSVIGTFFPTHEVPSITPEVIDANGNPLQVSMKDLMDCSPGSTGIKSLENLLSSYGSWIEQKAVEAAELSSSHLETASLHLDECRNALKRMMSGLELILSNEDARRAFELANASVLKQQLEIPSLTRAISRKKSGSSLTEVIVEEAPPIDPKGKGSWRPFQIGFLLSSLNSTIDPRSSDRELVELIFFPTGGGKTEAYQGLIAFSLFYSRLTNSDQGVGAIMRYTLRLLTAQQFTRAASLIACMEVIRVNENIGGERFTIGIWVGGSLSPLTRADACAEYKEMLGDPKKKHPFILNRCPLCSTSLGPAEGGKKNERWPGFEKSRSAATANNETIIFVCPNFSCEFSQVKYPIPAIVIDEDIFDQKPSLVIATIDKFAQVARNPRIRELFGIDDSGDRSISPPNLIIQDELHLISGPLGSVVGIYEGLFEELCIDRRDSLVSRPKIVCSTATIRNAGDQINGIFGRNSSALFPPNGIDISDSFFAKFARDEMTGELSHGRLYVGSIGTSLRSSQDLQMRVIAALAQAPMELPSEERDPWITNLSFFNRIQDIGSTFTLIQINVRAQLKGLWERMGVKDKEGRRYLWSQPTELTSRVDSADLPKKIDELSAPYGSGHIDVCLASNIIEVGIDIPRLSLMTILGQPKTTSQYIQVSGRVGRRDKDRPGLIVVMYPPRRARDRSHFEKFRSYHQRLYAEVEPTSVTPWATPVLERAIHAVIVGYIRTMCPTDTMPYPFPKNYFDEAVQILEERMQRIDPSQKEEFQKIVNRRKDEWRNRGRSVWFGDRSEDQLPLMYFAGTFLPEDKKMLAWETPSSLRNVDAECRVNVNDVYQLKGNNG